MKPTGSYHKDCGGALSLRKVVENSPGHPSVRYVLCCLLCGEDVSDNASRLGRGYTKATAPYCGEGGSRIE